MKITTYRRDTKYVEREREGGGGGREDGPWLLNTESLNLLVTGDVLRYSKQNKHFAGQHGIV